MNAATAELLPAASTTVAEYSRTAAALTELRSRYAGVQYEVTTTAGMKLAREARAELRSLRTDLEKTRVQIKAPALERCRQIDAEAKRITGELVALEDPIDAQIKAEEQRKADEKAEAERRERERLAAIQQRIEAIRGAALEYVGAPSAVIAEAIGEIEGDASLLEDFDETHLPDAQAALDQTVAKLREMQAAAETNERLAAELRAQREEQERQRLADEARLAEERKELERLRAAEEERIAEARRQADAERAEADRIAAEERRKADEAAQAERDRIAAEQAERQRELDDQAEKQRLAQEAADRAEKERREAEIAAAAERARKQEQAAIDAATLREAATEALAVLREVIGADHITTRKLAAALAKADE